MALRHFRKACEPLRSCRGADDDANSAGGHLGAGWKRDARQGSGRSLRRGAVGRQIEHLSEFFEHEVKTGKIPGAVVLIQQHGLPIYLKCFGVRDVTTHRPMTPDTIFALHSMTKPITSVAAMMLIDEGKLALSDPVSKYIPSFADVKVGIEEGTKDDPVLKLVPPDRPVNIEDLLRHTSGISYEYIGGPWVMKAYSDAHIFAGHFDNKVFAERIARLPLARQPGTLWRYGHSTDVLGRVIEIISGKSLYQFMKQRIFDPLGMTSTKFVLDGAAERARMAEPLPNDGILLQAEQQRRAHPEWQSGGGGLVSTLTDYARFAQMLLNGGKFGGRQYLSPAAFKLMTSDHVGPGSGVARDYFYFPGDGFGYGYGLAVRTEPGECKTAAARFDRRAEMGQRQRHLFRGRSETGHALHPDGADPERTWTHHTRFQETGL